MYTDSPIPGQIASERQRDVLARAEQQRRARSLSKTARQKERHEPYLRRAARAMAGLRTAMPRMTRQPASTLKSQ